MSEVNKTPWDELMRPTGSPDENSVRLAELAVRRVIEVGGTEARPFLQAILTQDIEAIEDGAGRFAALCSAKGRALGFLRVVAHGDRFLLVTRSDLAASLLKRLQMYVLRRDVQLALHEGQSAFGLIWPADTTTSDCPLSDPIACEIIDRLVRTESQPGQLPAAVDASGRLYLREDQGNGLRIAVHGLVAELAPLVRDARSTATVSAADWNRAEIEDHLPEITSETVEHYVPQWIGLDELDAFSLKKGCYPGQEVIARLHYLGKPNRQLFKGHVLGIDPPAAGTPVTNADGQSAGEVVRSAPLADHSGSLVLCVIRLKHLHDPLTIDGLPLALDPQDAIKDSRHRAEARH
ncbi:MAG TPA: hypothetical protein VFC95_00615 [Guyparkeria sp.]|nr:hypothetical protein [Guyparkeria sp.]